MWGGETGEVGEKEWEEGGSRGEGGFRRRDGEREVGR